MFLNALVQHSLSRLAGKIAYCQTRIIAQWLIHIAIKHLKIDLTEAEQTQFPSLNALFTRRLRTQYVITPTLTLPALSMAPFATWPNSI